ncbi:hypothetical protein DPEC_G00345850 [Dallia pectoralis]|uniref:Uncharacterized protein n=1 Tax=Dallia pectoralis TaxID=75939 RepID=A0ACC2F3N8_DALPE|nr:hypothetical protein DPEC_G00345850 [Dallia pectoralis]
MSLVIAKVCRELESVRYRPAGTTEVARRGTVESHRGERGGSGDYRPNCVGLNTCATGPRSAAFTSSSDPVWTRSVNKTVLIFTGSASLRPWERPSWTLA